LFIEQYKDLELTDTNAGIADAQRLFLDAVESFEGKEYREVAREILEDLVPWSIQVGLVHLPGGRQRQIRFVRPESKEIIWQVYPRISDGAKFDILPRNSKAFGEAVRSRVRESLTPVDGRKRRSSNTVPSISLAALTRTSVRSVAKQEILRLIDKKA
jgi:hypothetical protein